MNEGNHLDLDTWIVPGQIRKANLCRGLGNRYTPAGTEVLISAVAHNTPPPFHCHNSILFLSSTFLFIGVNLTLFSKFTTRLGTLSCFFHNSMYSTGTQYINHNIVHGWTKSAGSG